MRTIVIGWQGPYTLESVYESDLGHGLYFVSGRMKHERRDRIQYFGITERTYRERFKDRHHAVQKVTRNRQIWLGQIEYPSRFTRAHLELAEGCLIYFWGTSKLNRRKLAKPPQPVCLIARWLKPDGEVRLKRRHIYRDLLDVLWWDGEYWRTATCIRPTWMSRKGAQHQRRASMRGLLRKTVTWGLVMFVVGGLMLRRALGGSSRG